MSNEYLYTDEVNNPIWIFDVNGVSYKIDLSLRINSAKTYSIMIKSLCFKDRPETIDFFELCGKYKKSNKYYGYRNELYDTMDDAINSFPDDLRDGVRKIVEVCDIKDAEYNDESFRDIYNRTEIIKSCFKIHNDNFLEKSLTEKENECFYRYILSLSDEGVIDLWNRQFTYADERQAFERCIYENSRIIYDNLCHIDKGRAFDGKVYQKYNDYDLYIWREERLGEYPRVYTFSSVEEIHLRGELAMFIKRHPYIYIDVINGVREQLIYEEYEKNALETEK